jgi:hypothetical protein
MRLLLNEFSSLFMFGATIVGIVGVSMAIGIIPTATGPEARWAGVFLAGLMLWMPTICVFFGRLKRYDPKIYYESTEGYEIASYLLGLTGSRNIWGSQIIRSLRTIWQVARNPRSPLGRFARVIRLIVLLEFAAPFFACCSLILMGNGRT